VAGAAASAGAAPTKRSPVRRPPTRTRRELSGIRGGSRPAAPAMVRSPAEADATIDPGAAPPPAAVSPGAAAPAPLGDGTLSRTLSGEAQR
jgi:hypothetical protein